jgi:hypothetical protein
MTDLWDMIHYLVGFIILGLMLYLLVQINNYLSKDNIPIVPMKNQ